MAARNKNRQSFFDYFLLLLSLKNKKKDLKVPGSIPGRGNFCNPEHFFRWNKKYKAPTRFELVISCLLDRRFNQLSHGAEVQGTEE